MNTLVNGEALECVDGYRYSGVIESSTGVMV